MWLPIVMRWLAVIACLVISGVLALNGGDEWLCFLFGAVLLGLCSTSVVIQRGGDEDSQDA